jgi:flagellin
MRRETLRSSKLGLDKSLERLSSGFRINRAGDDAAGLAISENLRAQIRGLKQVSTKRPGRRVT